jgi:hypothetical protein
MILFATKIDHVKFATKVILSIVMAEALLWGV